MMYIYVLIFLVHSVSTKGHIGIPCKANTEQGVIYRRLTWYKVEEGSGVLTGLVLKDLLKNVTTLFKFANHNYEVSEDYSLLVPSLSKEDCGIYRCTLWPPLGHYIQEENTPYYSADCKKPQVQAVSSQKNVPPSGHHIKIFIIPCVLIACAVVFMFLNIKMCNKAKENYNLKTKLADI